MKRLPHRHSRAADRERDADTALFRTGNTVRLQYSSGIYKIASWAHITNAHLVPGEGILTGLASVGEPLGRGLLLLAEMSAKGNLATGDYTAKNVEAARRYPKFVMGFVAMRRVDEREETAGGVAPGEGVRRRFQTNVSTAIWADCLTPRSPTLSS